MLGPVVGNSRTAPRSWPDGQRSPGVMAITALDLRKAQLSYINVTGFVGLRSLNLATAVCAAIYEGVRQSVARGDITLDSAGRIINP